MSGETGSVLIGRGDGCQVVLVESSVSTTHARLERVGNQLFIEDLGSSNGTYVDGRRVAREHVTAHSAVAIGTVPIPWEHPAIQALRRGMEVATVRLDPAAVAQLASRLGYNNNAPVAQAVVPYVVPGPPAYGPMQAAPAGTANVYVAAGGGGGYAGRTEQVLLNRNGVAITTTRISIAGTT
ncbi:MAG: FHA domain-containing protein, partial [Deltaproteobacteria bacterium]